MTRGVTVGKLVHCDGAECCNFFIRYRLGNRKRYCDLCAHSRALTRGRRWDLATINRPHRQAQRWQLHHRSRGRAKDVPLADIVKWFEDGVDRSCSVPGCSRHPGKPTHLDFDPISGKIMGWFCHYHNSTVLRCVDMCLSAPDDFTFLMKARRNLRDGCAAH